MIDLGGLLTILELHRQGLSISAIAARLAMDRKTVRKYIKDCVRTPRYGPRAPRPCVVDAYVHYVTERVRTFPGLSTERLLREVRAMSCQGGRTALGDFVREVRLREHADLLPDQLRSRPSALNPASAEPVRRRRGRPRKEQADQKTG
jgi:transposase